MESTLTPENIAAAYGAYAFLLLDEEEQNLANHNLNSFAENNSEQKT